MASSSTAAGEGRAERRQQQQQEPQGQQRKMAPLQEQVQEVMLQVLRLVHERSSHIPPVVTSDVAPFPFDISIPTSSSDSSAFGIDMLKRMLLTPPPHILT
eukprot:TRINITY_DN2955_c0_g2_i1.p3 TRINITY_DN2955_c0_g2~~TRINITY_DN2955_c0_g2_i1.p3  ORF type:complete len:101 (-),score=46.52 TRINITY_DN2955_c0_g2_i1:165-467(-)